MWIHFEIFDFLQTLQQTHHPCTITGMQIIFQTSPGNISKQFCKAFLLSPNSFTVRVYILSKDNFYHYQLLLNLDTNHFRRHDISLLWCLELHSVHSLSHPARYIYIVLYYYLITYWENHYWYWNLTELYINNILFRNISSTWNKIIICLF